MPIDPLTLSMIASTAMSASGSIMSGKAKKKLAQEQVAQKKRASAELDVRKNINKQAIGTAAQAQRAEIVSGVVSSGFTADSTSSMEFLNQSLAREFQEYSNLEREVEYEKATLKAEAASILKGGESAQKASYFEAGSSILGGVNSFLDAGGMAGMKTRVNNSYGLKEV